MITDRQRAPDGAAQARRPSDDRHAAGQTSSRHRGAARRGDRRSRRPLIALNEALLTRPEGFTVNAEAGTRSSTAGAAASSRRRDRVGTGRSAGLRLDSRGRHSDPPDRAGLGARHVRASQCWCCTTPSPASAMCRCRIFLRPAPPSPSTTARSPKTPRWASNTATASMRRSVLVLWEGAVRRLRQRRAGHHRPVPGLRLREMAADALAGAAAAARLRGQRPGTLQRPPRTLPAACAPTTISASPTAPRPRSISICCAVRRPCWKATRAR